MAGVIPELPPDIIDFESGCRCLKFPVKDHTGRRGQKGLSPWKFTANVKTLASKIVQGPAGSYGTLYVKLAVNDDQRKGAPNMNFNGCILGPVYVFCVFVAEFQEGMPDDAIDLHELTGNLSDDEVKAGPY